MTNFIVYENDYPGGKYCLEETHSMETFHFEEKHIDEMIECLKETKRVANNEQ